MHDSTHPDTSLEPGVFLIETTNRRSTAIHQAALGYLASTGGSALWLDACDHATMLSQLQVPYDRTAIQFSRSRDCYEHHDVARSLPADLCPSTDLVVAPCVASFYDGDHISRSTGRKYLASTLGGLTETAEETRTPVFATCVTGSQFIDMVRKAAVTRVRVERTDNGFRFEPGEFETAVMGRSAPSVPAISSWEGPTHPFAYMGTVQELADRGFIPDGL